MGRRRADKTTLVSRKLTRWIEVVNPDDIAQELLRTGGRLNERRAGEIAIARRSDLLARRDDGRFRYVASEPPGWAADSLFDLLERRSFTTLA